MYRSTSCVLMPKRVPRFMNLSLIAASCPTRWNNYLSLSTGMRVRWSFKKFYLGCSSVGLSRKLSYGILGIGSAALLLPNNNSSIINCRLSVANLCTMPRNCAMLNCKLLYNNSSRLTHST
jgi:hypothetical protein